MTNFSCDKRYIELKNFFNCIFLKEDIQRNYKPYYNNYTYYNFPIGLYTKDDMLYLQHLYYYSKTYNTHMGLSRNLKGLDLKNYIIWYNCNINIIFII